MLRDEQIVALMVAARDRRKLVKRFGARKMWLHLRGQGHDVARFIVPTWSGRVYVAFVFDVLSRMSVGWGAATSMTTDLVLDTLEMAIWNRARARITDLTGLVHHTDAGSPGHLLRVHHPTDRGWRRPVRGLSRRPTPSLQ